MSNWSTARRMVGLGMAAAVFSCLFVLSFGYAQHSPHPHGVRIDVVASPSVTSQVRIALDRAAPDGFDVRSASDAGTARRDLRHMASDGGLIVRGTGPAQLLTAGAAGIPLQQAVTNALTSVMGAQGRKVQSVDVVPLPSEDRAGLSAFDLELGLLVPAVLAAIGLFLLGRRARLWIRVAGALAYAVIAAAFGVLMLDVSLGALTGATWALFGDTALVAATLALTVVALHCLFGLPGTLIAAGGLVLVGNAINGSAVPTRLLPDVYRQIAPWSPNSAAVSLVRSDVYFGGHGQSGPLTTLTIWVAAAVLVIVITDLLQSRLRRAHSELASQVNGTSLVGLIRGGRIQSQHQRWGRSRPDKPAPEPVVEVARDIEEPDTSTVRQVEDDSGHKALRCDVALTRASRQVVVTVSYPAA